MGEFHIKPIDNIVPKTEEKKNDVLRELDDDLEPEPQPDLTKVPYLYHDSKEIVAEIKKGTRVFGTPAASLSWGIDGDANKPQLVPGIEGEKETAKILTALTEKYPNLFLFNSLSWPESNGDTDHMLVYGNLMIIVDSKRWKKTRKYSISEKGQIKRGTVAFPEGKVHMLPAMITWRKKFPNMRVMGVVSIAQEKVFVVQDRAWGKAPFRLVTSETLPEQIDYMLSHYVTKKKVQGKDLVNLGLLLVKERNRIEELINVSGLERKYKR